MDNSLIKRQAAIDYLMTNMTWYDEDGCETDEDGKRYIIEELINGVPSAQPEILACGHGELVQDGSRLVQDTISRQSAIDALIKRDPNCGIDGAEVIRDLPSAQPDSGYIEQIRWERDVAIQQLADLGYSLGEKPRTNGDLISRRKAINTVEDAYKFCDGDIEAYHDAMVASLTELIAERTTGHLYLLDECANAGYYCSECHKKIVKDGWSKTAKKIKFCPNCGCRMMEVEHDDISG